MTFPARLLLLVAIFAGASSLQAQSSIAEISPVPGYEQTLTRKLRETLKNFNPKTDNLGNVYVTLGSGSPHRLIATPMDEPGYIVSAITPDGYLRVQRLPQVPPNAVFDTLSFAQPVWVITRGGKRVNGVFAGLSVHLQPGRQNIPKMNHPDELYVDIGAKTAQEVRAAGVAVLDPLLLNQEMHKDPSVWTTSLYGIGLETRPGVLALWQLPNRVDWKQVKGQLTIAFVAQEWAGGRGLDRLLAEISPDEMVYLGRVRAKPPMNGGALAEPLKPGSGVLIGIPNEPTETGAEFVKELQTLAERIKVPVAAVVSANPPRISGFAKGSALPKRIAVVGVPTLWPVTPAEWTDSKDFVSLNRLLCFYAMNNLVLTEITQDDGSCFVIDACASGHGEPGDVILSKEELKSLNKLPVNANVLDQSRKNSPLAALTEVYGASGHEGAVREEVKKLLPEWARKEADTDAAGNLVLHLGDAKGRTNTKKIAIVAHMDEIGYEVKKIEDDGRLLVDVLGGGYTQYFLGHVALVHKADGGKVAGVLELPEGWDEPAEAGKRNFEWPLSFRSMDEPAHAYIGTKSKEETEKLGIKAGDYLTIPKAYRPLLGTRANGRSFDDRVGCAALIEAVRLLGPQLPGRNVTFIWSTREEVGLEGAAAAAERMAKEGNTPDFVFAIDTFVSSDSPLETKRFADAELGKGFVVRVVDNSNITPREYVDRVVKLANTNKIRVQFGVTGGGNDGSVFLRYGAVDIPLGWPLRYSHSPAEVIDTRDETALARIIAVIARDW